MAKHWTQFVRGKQKRGTMNKSEEDYATLLKVRKLAGEIIEFWFEAITFKLADDTRYTPDFLVFMADGTMECHEVKGFWADDAKIKIKIAAEKFPFRFVAVLRRAKKDGGGWEYKDYSGGEDTDDGKSRLEKDIAQFLNDF